jgi:AraC-like DNA-binding protein
VTGEHAIRPQWSFLVAEAFQHFVGAVELCEPGRLLEGASQLGAELPAPLGDAEALMLGAQLGLLLTRAARSFDARFHACFDGSCSGDGLYTHVTSCDRLPSGVSAECLRWAREFLCSFERHHAWPAAVRAAVLLQHEYSRPWRVDTLARAVASSRASLNRGFRSVYGMSCHEYLTLLRIREAIEQLREPGSFVDAVTFSVGYRSSKDLYLAIAKVTGLRLAAVRSLDDTAWHRVMEGPLALPAPRRRKDPPIGRRAAAASAADRL